MPLDPIHLAALSAILRLGSFDAAAGALGVTPSAVSQRLKALEEQVGATLIHRSQPCRATGLGARLAKHAEDVALLEAQALGQTQTPRPRLSLAVPADALATWMMPALAAVPDLLFDVVIDDQDTADDWLRRGAVSAAITGNDRAAPGCDLLPLGAMRYVATASPQFMRTHFAAGVNASTLAQAPMMVFNSKDQLQSRWINQITGKRLHPPGHHLPSTHGFVDAALCGMGWGMNPEPLVREHLAHGSLIALAKGATLDVPLYWQCARVMAPALAPLTRAVESAAHKHLHPTSG